MQSVSYPQPSCPDDDEILLSEGLSTIGGNFSGTCFNDKATKSILQGGAPFNGNLRPIDRPGSFNNQKSPNGLWKFRIKNTLFAANLGQLFYWSPLFTKKPGPPFTLSSSALPIVYIGNYGKEIPDDPKISGYLRVYDNGRGEPNKPIDTPLYISNILELS